MSVKASKLGDAVVLELEGTIDGKAATETEKVIAAHVTADVRFVIVDMAGVQLLTSAGIRQLLLLRKRLASARGGLVLCAVNDRVRTLLEIAGLLAQFSLADTREQALAGFESMQQGAAEPPPPTSRIGAMLFSLLGGQEVASSRPGDEKDDAAVDALVSHLNAILGGQGGASSKPPAHG